MNHILPDEPTADLSPFGGALVHELLGLQLAADAPRPRFEQDLWDLSGVVGAPVQFNLNSLRWDFTHVPRARWRMVLKEFLIAVAVPLHPAVRHLPWARRLPLSLRSCAGLRFSAAQWFRWLADAGVDSLTDVTQEHCDRYLAELRAAGLAADSLRAKVAVVKDLGRYTELFTTDHYPAGFMPWPKATAAMVAGARSRGENKTPPVADDLLQPALRSALYLVTSIGPHVADLAELLTRQRAAPRVHRNIKARELDVLLRRYRDQGEPLPELADRDVNRRTENGWRADDPILHVSGGELARELGVTQLDVRKFRPLIEPVVTEVGVAPAWARDAEPVERADSNGTVAWTPPLTVRQIDDVVLAVFNAAVFLTAQVTGMRSSEMMELTSSSCLPPQHVGDGLQRFKLTSKVIKGQQWGGIRDEWVVIEPAYRAVELAIRLARTMPRLTTNTAGPDNTIFGRYLLQVRFDALREWINGPAGQRLGLPILPSGHLHQSMARRTLALEMAHRPHGLWATQVHLKQVEIATTEGYAARPGGAQGRLHAEMKQEEHARRLGLTVAAYRDYQQGRLPAGPGAASLIAAFQHVDRELSTTDTTQPLVVTSDRHVELLLKKRAAILHIQPANYCWFTDPRKALCLKLAGTPTATTPLAGLCDAARCTQATFHPEHRSVWAGRTRTTETFLGNPRVPAGEKKRLETEHIRGLEVLQAIDDADTAARR